MSGKAFLSYQFQKMKKYKITLMFLQLLASTIILIKEANAGRFEYSKAIDEAIEEKDLEMETIEEKDVFPDVISFATHPYQ
jgi:hypothetical protein